LIEFIQISTTVNSKQRANKIAHRLLDARVASCVQVLGPIQSNYWWKGKIERAKEWICLIKARADDFRRIEAAIKNLHPYATPEILGFSVLYGNPDYLRWITDETSRKPKPKTRRNRI
jgi:periplasmic divalent cation tolerance protein